MLQAVFFDFDGVLVDSVNIKEDVFGLLYREYGEVVEEKVRKHHRSHGGISRFEKFSYYHQAFLGKNLSLQESETLNQMFSDLVKRSIISAPEMPNAVLMLSKLYSKFPLHVISATPEIELEEIIIKREMRGFFSSIHGAPKKKSIHMNNLIKMHNYDRRKVVMIGDSSSDYEAACEVGVHFVGYVPLVESNIFPEHVIIIADLLSFVEYISLC